MASLVTATDDEEMLDTDDTRDPIQIRRDAIIESNNELTLNGLKPEYFNYWNPREHSDKIDVERWINNYGKYPLAHWGEGTYSGNDYKLHTCDGVVQQIGFYNDNRLRRWGNKVRKTGYSNYMVMKCIPCPHKKGFITRGRFNENKIPQGWGVYRLRQASVTSSSYDEITFTYCPVCMERQKNQRIKELNNRGRNKYYNLNRTGHHWLHVRDSRGRSEYEELNNNNWRNRIITITQNVDQRHIDGIIGNHRRQLLLETRPQDFLKEMPLKFCVNVARCGNSFWVTKPPRWQRLENGFKCQACYEMSKVAPVTNVDFTRPRERGPSSTLGVTALPLEVARHIWGYGQGGRRKYRKKRTRGKKRTRKRRKKRRTRKRRKSRRRKKR